MLPTTRSTPTQQRGAERIHLILDTTAAFLDEVGRDGISTTAIAKRAGSSVGVIYRYFPNMASLLNGLAERNAHRYLALLRSELPEDRDDWLNSIDVSIDVYLSMMELEPGFSTVLFGDSLGTKVTDRNEGNALAQLFAEILTTKYGFKTTPDLMFALEVSVEVAEVLIARAFRFNNVGDTRFISKAREMARIELSAVPIDTLAA